jgi:hypothetical protein
MALRLENAELRRLVPRATLERLDREREVMEILEECRRRGYDVYGAHAVVKAYLRSLPKTTRYRLLRKVPSLWHHPHRSVAPRMPDRLDRTEYDNASQTLRLIYLSGHEVLVRNVTPERAARLVARAAATGAQRGGADDGFSFHRSN